MREKQHDRMGRDQTRQEEEEKVTNSVLLYASVCICYFGVRSGSTA